MRNTTIMKDRFNTALATIFLSTSVGVTICCLTFILKGEDITALSTFDFFESIFIYTLISSIYFTIRATIYQVNRERKLMERYQKMNEIKFRRKNQKLKLNIGHVS